MTRAPSLRVIVGLHSPEAIAIDHMLVTYNVYLQLGVDGLRGLANFNVDDQVSLIVSPESAKLISFAEMGPSA
jgi:hypothetical protein